METKTVKIPELKAGPMHEDVLPEGFIQRVIKFKETLREVETSSLEKTINNFQRDLHPEKELLVWENIATHYQDYISSHPNLDLQAKRQVFSQLLLSTLGV